MLTRMMHEPPLCRLYTGSSLGALLGTEPKSLVGMEPLSEPEPGSKMEPLLESEPLLEIEPLSELMEPLSES